MRAGARPNAQPRLGGILRICLPAGRLERADSQAGHRNATERDIATTLDERALALQ